MILHKSSVLNKTITLLCPSRPSHVIVIKGFYLLSVCLKKNILKNGILRKKRQDVFWKFVQTFLFFVQNSNKCREKYPKTGKRPLKTNIIYAFCPSQPSQPIILSCINTLIPYNVKGVKGKKERKNRQLWFKHASTR